MRSRFVVCVPPPWLKMPDPPVPSARDPLLSEPSPNVYVPLAAAPLATLRNPTVCVPLLWLKLAEPDTPRISLPATFSTPGALRLYVAVEVADVAKFRLVNG